MFFSRNRLIPVIFCSFIFSALAPLALAATFPDVPENTVNYNAVEYLKQKGVVSGYPDGSFQPDKTINRAEALKMVLLASAKIIESAVTLPFPDIDESEWYYDYVRRAFELGVVSGYPDGLFKAGNNINVAESLKMIMSAFQESLQTNLADNPYPDVEKDLWYATYADYCRNRQLIWPLDDGKLHAEREITRSEFAQIIYRLMYVQENKLEKFPLSTDWPVYTHPTDHYALKYPFGWKVIPAGSQTVFWKQDTGNNQISFGRIYPNSATVTVAVDANADRVLLDDYLNSLKYYKSGVTQNMTLNGYPFASISVADTGSFDYFFELPNKSILAAFADIGDGLNRPYLLDELRNIIGSIRYSEETAEITDRDTFLSKIREKILVEGAAQDALDFFDEIILVETDTIGIGTGPVDYYYSAEHDVTLKIERNSNTLLGIRDGKTTAF